MFDTCLACGHNSPEDGFLRRGEDLLCDACGHRHPLKKQPLFVVFGPPGAGKSTLYDQVLTMPERPDLVYFLSDYLGVLAQNGRGSLRAYLLLLSAVISRSGRPVVLFDGSFPSDYEASSRRDLVSDIHYLGLTCSLEIQEQRLRSRPEWRMSGHDDSDIQAYLDANRRLAEEVGTADPGYALLDTGRQSRARCATELFAWIRSHQAAFG